MDSTSNDSDYVLHVLFNPARRGEVIEKAKRKFCSLSFEDAEVELITNEMEFQSRIGQMSRLTEVKVNVFSRLVAYADMLSNSLIEVHPDNARLTSTKGIIQRLRNILSEIGDSSRKVPRVDLMQSLALVLGKNHLRAAPALAGLLAAKALDNSEGLDDIELEWRAYILGPQELYARQLISGLSIFESLLRETGKREAPVLDLLPESIIRLSSRAAFLASDGGGSDPAAKIALPIARKNAVWAKGKLRNYPEWPLA